MATFLDAGLGALRAQRIDHPLGDRGSGLGVLASYVVLACPKFVCKHVIHDLGALDPVKANAMASLAYVPYMVVNVLLNEDVDLEFYDIFRLRDSKLPLGFFSPCGPPFGHDDSPVIDVLNGAYARPEPLPRTVLTLYWSVLCPTARFEMAFYNPWKRWAERFLVQLDDILAMVEMTRKNIVQVRMSRWGHALPVAAPALIANGTIAALRRPIDERIFFVNQDNWALPAVENSILDAEVMTTRIRAKLG